MGWFYEFWFGDPLELPLREMTSAIRSYVLTKEDVDYYTREAINCVRKHKLDPVESAYLIREARREAFLHNAEILKDLLDIKEPTHPDRIIERKLELNNNLRAGFVFGQEAETEKWAARAHLKSAWLTLKELEENESVMRPEKVLNLEKMIHENFVRGGGAFVKGSRLDKQIARAVEERLIEYANLIRGKFEDKRVKNLPDYWRTCRDINALVALMPSARNCSAKAAELSRDLYPDRPVPPRNARKKQTSPIY